VLNGLVSMSLQNEV